MREGIFLSVLTLVAGSFTVVGASVNAPLIRAGLGLTEVGVGSIASIAYLGAMFSSRIGGRTTDSRGPTLVIFAGMMTMATGIGVAALAVLPPVFYIGVLLTGLGYGAVNPATNVLANPVTARRRGLVMSVKQAGVPIGGILAGAVLPVIGSNLGWRRALLAPLLLCCSVALLMNLRGRRRISLHGAATQMVRSTVRFRLPHGFLYGFAMAGAQVSIFAFTSVYLVEARGLSISRAGLGVSLLMVGGVVGRLLWGWGSDLFPKRRLRILQALSFLGAISITMVWTVPIGVLPVALAFIGICTVGWNGVYIAAIAEASVPRDVGRTTGASLSMINLGAVITPLATGFIVQTTHSWAYGWISCSALSLLGMAAISFSRIKSETGAEVEVP